MWEDAEAARMWRQYVRRGQRLRPTGGISSFNHKGKNLQSVFPVAGGGHGAQVTNSIPQLTGFYLTHVLRHGPSVTGQGLTNRVQQQVAGMDGNGAQHNGLRI